MKLSDQIKEHEHTRGIKVLFQCHEAELRVFDIGYKYEGNILFLKNNAWWVSSWQVNTLEEMKFTVDLLTPYEDEYKDNIILEFLRE